MREYVLVLLTAAVASYLLTPLVRVFALRVGAAPAVRDRDVHTVPIPRLGGLAMYGGLCAGMLVAHQMPRLKAVFENTTWAGVLLAGGLLVLIGMIDDRWGIGALSKFAGQVAAAGILILNGVQVQWLPMPTVLYTLTQQQSIVLTVLVVVVTVNGVNFIDGLDGLAAGVVCIAASAFFLYSYVLYVIDHFQSRQTDSGMFSVLLVGMCVGFIPHNFNPARIFMGDTGSMLLGLLLASSTIMLTSVDTNSSRSMNLPVLLPLLLPIAVLAVPVLDVALAVARRTSAGMSPFAPDKKHLHHRLLSIGHSQRRAVVLMYLWAGLLSAAMASLAFVHSFMVVFTVAGLLAVCLVFLVTLPRIRGRRGPVKRVKSPAQRGSTGARGGEGGDQADGMAKARQSSL